MHEFNETQHSPYSTQQLFDLVIDIERYPDFLPWCRASRILERNENKVLAELVISFKHITESYTSEVKFQRPATAQDSGFIDVIMVRGPFEKLENHWKFIPSPEGSTIDLNLSFKFRSRILDSIIGLLFGKASAKMVNAFNKRADELYGHAGQP
ncbi:MAG TPA: type II toxin-antitoxin system RatA family toxin [Rickettsiales bacterium]|nr:type II toxin-antitoxin system RatA family toxin [Rickettsiales bacterium]